MHNNPAQQDRKDVERLTNELARCENDLQVALSQAATARAALAEADLAHRCSEATLHMTVARLGGTVEGRPTHRINFLQRVDALRRIEEEAARFRVEVAPSPLPGLTREWRDLLGLRYRVRTRADGERVAECAYGETAGFGEARGDANINRFADRVADLDGQLAERDAALAAAGEALARAASLPVIGMDGDVSYDQCPVCKVWADPGAPIDHDIHHCWLGRSLSSPALARAVAIDRARRELCEGVRLMCEYGADPALRAGAMARALLAVQRSDERLRALEAEPAPSEPAP